MASATLFLTFSNAIVRALGLLTLPIVTELLSPTSYGTAALVGTIISLMSVISLAGMDMSYVRAYTATNRDHSLSVENFAWTFALLSSTLGSLAISGTWSFLAEAFGISNTLAPLVGAGILCSTIGVMAQTRGRLNARYRAMSASILCAGICTAAINICGAKYWRQDEVPLVVSLVFANFLPILVIGAPSVQQLFSAPKLRIDEQMSIFRIGLPGIVTAPAYWVLTSSDRWFLGIYASTSEVGIYAIGCAIGSIGLMANSAVMSVWTPEITKAFSSDPENAPISLGRLAEKVIVGFSIVWLAVTASGGDLVRLVTFPTFHKAAGIVPYISGGVFFYGLQHLAYAGLLVAKRLDYAMWCWLAGATLCLLLNSVLVPPYGATGAALSQIICFSIICAAIFYASQRHTHLEIRWWKLSLIVGFVIPLGLLMFPAWSSSPVVSLVTKFPLGMIALIAIGWTVAPEILRANVIGRNSITKQ